MQFLVEKVKMAATKAAIRLVLLVVVALCLSHCVNGVCQTGKFGGSCQHTCHCKNETSCDADSGQCDSQGCQADHKEASCQKYNVARSGVANSSDYWSAPDLAIDGLNSDGNFSVCFHSAGGEEFYPAWWRVDLGAVYSMDDIVVHYWHSEGEIDRSTGTIVNILNSTDGPAEHCLTYDVPKSSRGDFSCSQSGRVLELRRLNRTITVCEVQVFVCLPNTYGVHCVPCGECLQGGECDRGSGACPRGCAVGWGGRACNTPCAAGTYGHSCNATCGQCAQGPCDRRTGLCSRGCQTGWRGPRCDLQCTANTFGSECTSCGHCLGCAQCDANTGGCPQGCTPGWSGDRCDSACPPGTFGAFCSLICGRCQGNSFCHHVTGICPDGCQDGWEGPACHQPVSTGCQCLQYKDGFAAGIGVGFGIALALALIAGAIAVAVHFRRRCGAAGDRESASDKRAGPQGGTREVTIVNASAEAPPEEAVRGVYDPLDATTREEDDPHHYGDLHHYQN